MTNEKSAALAPLESQPMTYQTLRAIANTDMVPKSLRGKPDAMLAAVLAGRELGLPPMESMRAIDIIDGRPSLSGELMLRLIREAGHKVQITMLPGKGAKAVGIRAEDPDDQMEVQFTLEDAKRASLAGKDTYKKYPEMMCAWRCVTMLGRFQFPDVIGAIKMTYTPEELGADEWTENTSPEVLANAMAEVSDEDLTAEERDEDDGEVVEAEIIEDGADNQDAAPPQPDEDEPKPVLPSQAPGEDESNGLVDAEGAQWSELHKMLSIADATAGTREQIERRTRKMYALMRAVGLYPDEDGTDQLHHDLMTHYGAEHWGDLEVKANMQAFAEQAFALARTVVEAHIEDTGGSMFSDE